MLVKNVSLRGKHKIGDRWEHDPYVVIDQPNDDIPVYEVGRQNTRSRKSKLLHRNLLLPFMSLTRIEEEEEEEEQEQEQEEQEEDDQTNTDQIRPDDLTVDESDVSDSQTGHPEPAPDEPDDTSLHLQLSESSDSLSGESESEVASVYSGDESSVESDHVGR